MKIGKHKIYDNFSNLFYIEEYYPENIPCPHPGCLSHISHPCEYCGRIAGKGDYKNKNLVLIGEYI